MGSQTFGKGTVQTLIPLFRGQMKITNAKFYRVSGESTQHRGVIPDILYPEIYDVEKIGESALEEALPWDKISESKYTKQDRVSANLDKLKKQHDQRVEKNPDFLYLNDQIKFLKELRDDTSISLNIKTREKERKNNEDRRLSLENKRRIAKGLTPLTELSDDQEETETTDKKDKNEDALLVEGGEIMVDYINLNPENRITSK